MLSPAQITLDLSGKTLSLTPSVTPPVAAVTVDAVADGAVLVLHADPATLDAERVLGVVRALGRLSDSGKWWGV